MKFVISIFLLACEIDDLERIVNQLKAGSFLLSGKHQWIIDVNLCLADDMVNWQESSIPKSYFTEKLECLSARTDWCEARFSCHDHIKGCVSQRRKSWLENRDADYFIWLDSDIVFSERTLTFVEQAAERLIKTCPMHILTPEIVRIWDSTWDCLVNEQYLGKPIGYQQDNDPFSDAGIKGKVSMEEVKNTIKGQPIFKFAGGWFTCLSAPLLNKIGVPETFGHYGLEDTFIMWAAERLTKQHNIEIKQFRLKNVIICENYRYRDAGYLSRNIAAYNRKDEFRKIAESNFQAELSRLTP